MTDKPDLSRLYKAVEKLPKPYHDDGKGRLIYHGDCRELLPLMNVLGVIGCVVTDPPYPNTSGHFIEEIESAGVLRDILCNQVLVFWHELEKPPVELPLVAKHIWHRTNVNGKVYEPIYHFEAEGKKRRSDIKQGAAIFDGAGPGCAEYCGHPTQKPLHVMAWLLSKTRGIVVDPFSGSGSTLVAAKHEGRLGIGIEIEERYCEIAANRLAQEVLF